jgi:thimet oligopeptidase
MNFLKAAVVILPVTLFTLSCAVTPKQTNKGFSVIRYEFEKGELTKLCEKSIQETKTQLDAVGKVPASDRTMDNTILKMEEDLAYFSDVTTPLTFMGYVSRDENLRKEAETCEKSVGQFVVEVFTRKDLYNAIKDLKGRNPAEGRLLKETIDAFEKNGLKLDDSKLAQLRELKQKLTTLESEFAANVNNDKSTVEFTPAELDGVTETLTARLKKNAAGNYVVTTKSTDYMQVMQSAKSSEARKKMMLAYYNRAGITNTKILEEAILLRQKIANLMGYKTWSDYRTTDRMAKSSKEVSEFLNGLKTKLAKRNKADLDQLLKFKKETDPKTDHLDAWDLTYLAYQLKKRDYQLDDEKIREYFPADFVMKEMFGIYSQILGVTYEKVENANVWASDVYLYKVLDKKTGQLISYFHTDFTPREGKYSHAAAFTLLTGRMKNGEYTHPVSSIVANFNPPANGKPSLLNHDEVETLFHEFGHIMHQTLTKAPFASLSGTSVKQDFVEAPSQMLENWVWEKPILNRLSGHYTDTSKKLPAELLKKMLEARDFNQGYFYTRQLFLGLFDFNIHTSIGPVDVTKAYEDVHEKISGIKAIPGGHFAAGFTHMMGGYDAGYYGYLWSEVYAQDMFTRFDEGKLLDADTGYKYRTTILEKGNMEDPLKLITEFIGRKPNQNAFFKRLGIKH